ncbi:MAG: glycerol acyltransferase [Microscillaceae bacterium]|nr:glycerol acyltransferase [Microscillaceae bacterium]
MTPIEQYYFRAEFVGFEGEDFPERNNPKHPLIFASNHSGMAFPWDGIIFASGLMRLNDYQLRRATRGMASPMLSKTKLMNPFLIHNFWKRVGGIDATMLNFETMMHYGQANVLIYPEGVPGIGKGFNRRYQLQRLSTSALRLSIKYKTDIIPFATVNAEYINPFSYSIDWVNELVQKIGVPFLPLGPTLLLALLQPWMFYFAFPAKLIFVRGRRVKPYEMVNKPFEALSQEEIIVLRDKIHSQMQVELNRAVANYGTKPYHWGEFLRTVVQNWRKIPYFMPFAWPFIFIEHERRYQELQAKLRRFGGDTPEDMAQRQAAQEDVHGNEEESLMAMVKTAAKTIARNPEVLLFYVPIVGWIPTLIKGYQKE